MMEDARLITALALFIIGGLVMYITMRLWRTHPVNRAFLLGPYVTEEGMRLILSHWITLFTLGLTAIAEGVARIAYWAMRSDYVGSTFANIFGVVEAIFTTWAAICIVSATVALCRKP